METVSVVTHREHRSKRPFDTVVADFEAAIGIADEASFRAAVAGSMDVEDFEKRMHAFEGSSGFMLFTRMDHGAWLARIGQKARAILYILGNPLIARTMLTHNLGAGLHVPVRVLIHEDPATGMARLTYDLPSSLMAHIGNGRLLEAARGLDQKLTNLAELATGVKA
jgi:uncharacterized protein (DUF302 family)